MYFTSENSQFAVNKRNSTLMAAILFCVRNRSIKTDTESVEELYTSMQA